MKILVWNLWDKKWEKGKNYMELCLQAFDIEKKYKKKAVKISFELNPVKDSTLYLKTE